MKSGDLSLEIAIINNAFPPRDLSDLRAMTFMPLVYRCESVWAIHFSLLPSGS